MNAPVGIYGGTFDPIHLGHLRAAEEVVDALSLDRMIFVPSAEPPHKRGASRETAAAEQRLLWTQLAVKDNPRFEVDGLELERSGPSYSVDTLQVLRERLAPAPLVFVLGCDAFELIDTWREPDRVFELAHLAVTTRPPINEARLEAWLPAALRGALELAEDGRSARHRRSGNWLRVVEITSLDISSSDIRERLRCGASCRYLLPETLRSTVEESGVYRELGARAEGVA